MYHLVPSPHKGRLVCLSVFISVIFSSIHVMIYIHATRKTHGLQSREDAQPQINLITPLVSGNVTIATVSNKSIIKLYAKDVHTNVPKENGNQNMPSKTVNMSVNGKKGLHLSHLTQFRKIGSETFKPKPYKNMDGNRNRNRNRNGIQMNKNIPKNKNQTGVHGHHMTKTLTGHVRPQCRDLIDGNVSQIQEAILYGETHPYKPTLSYTDRTKNCTRFLKQRGYIMDVSAEETGFPLAFSIVMYKNVEQVERLLRAIYRPSNFYCVHVDKKMYKKDMTDTKAIVDCLPNVFLASAQINVRWGTLSVLKADLKCMEDLWAYQHWKYFINLTGTEFPLKTNREIVRILKTLKGANIVDAEKEVEKWKRIRWAGAGPPPAGISLHKGNTHVLVSREFVGYVLHSPVVHNFTIWLRNTRIPDETFFPSLNHSPLLRAPGSFLGDDYATDYDNKPYIARFKNWGPNAPEKSFEWPCHGKRVREICIFGVGDLPLLTSRRELFANKFYINYQSQTLDCMEEWLSDRAREEQKGPFQLNVTFYEQMPNLKNVCRQNCTRL